MSAPIPNEVTSAIADLKTSIEKSVSAKANASDIQAISDKMTALEVKVEKSIKVGEDNRAKDPTGGFAHGGDFLLSVYKAAVNEEYDDRLKVLKSMDKSNADRLTFEMPIGLRIEKGANSPSGSSTLDFPQFPAYQTQIRTTEYEYMDFSNLTTTIPIDPAAQSVEIPWADDLDRSGGTVYGGIKAYSKSETEQMTSTSPTRRVIKLEPQEYYVFSYASDKQLRNNAYGYAQFLLDGMQKSLTFKLGDDTINGNGVGRLTGLLAANGTDKISVAKTTNQPTGTINEANIAQMWKRMPDAWRSQAVWLANQDIEDQLDLMVRTSFSAVSATTVVTPAIDTVLYNRERNTLKGRPIIFTEFCPTLGTEGDLILWCPKQYLTARKVGSGLQQSIHFKFDTAQTAFRMIYEADGKPAYPSVLTPYKGSTTRSSIVTLATR